VKKNDRLIVHLAHDSGQNEAGQMFGPQLAISTV
jgi:hypothetical protein